MDYTLDLDINTLKDTDFKKIYAQTVTDMKNLGVYKDEFIPVITRYAELRVQYIVIMGKWYATGCEITEDYTNKAGATNARKTALYQAVENLRHELADHESMLGLTPQSLKKINDKNFQTSKKSSLAEALKNFD